MERLFAVRQAAYATAHLRVNAETDRPGDIAERILEALELQ
jgi:hypothetical protein